MLKVQCVTNKSTTTGRIELAKQLSKHFHKGRMYGKHDYYEYHITGVVNTLELVAKELSEDMIIVALLHDVLENAPCTYDTIENIFGTWIADCVQRLSKTGHYNMIYYMEEIGRYKTTQVVKYADSLFNHQECVKVGDTKRAEKYQRNLQQLYSKELFKC